jgi:hypothetical protein
VLGPTADRVRWACGFRLACAVANCATRMRRVYIPRSHDIGAHAEENMGDSRATEDVMHANRGAYEYAFAEEQQYEQGLAELAPAGGTAAAAPEGGALVGPSASPHLPAVGAGNPVAVPGLAR